MGLKDYEGADCKLFRRPVIDYSEVTELLEESLVKAYESGGSASSVVDSLVSSSGIKSGLIKQVEDSMSFKRANLMKDYERRRNEQLSRLEEEARKQKAEATQEYRDANAQLREDKSSKEEALRELYAQTLEAGETFEDLRGSLEGRIEEFGGEEALMEILNINNYVLGDEGDESDFAQGLEYMKEDIKWGKKFMNGVKSVLFYDLSNLGRDIRRWFR